MEEIARWLHNSWDHPLHEEVTVTRVELTPDHQFADIWVILHEDSKEVVSPLLEDLTAIIPLLTGYLGRSLRLKRIPHLRFHYDYPVVRGAVVESILFQEIQKRKKEEKN
jgi:ribosome-binding factor A